MVGGCTHTAIYQFISVADGFRRFYDDVTPQFLSVADEFLRFYDDVTPHQVHLERGKPCWRNA
jgi:hypothetical protein